MQVTVLVMCKAVILRELEAGAVASALFVDSLHVSTGLPRLLRSLPLQMSPCSAVLTLHTNRGAHLLIVQGSNAGEGAGANTAYPSTPRAGAGNLPFGGPSGPTSPLSGGHGQVSPKGTSSQ